MGDVADLFADATPMQLALMVGATLAMLAISTYFLLGVGSDSTGKSKGNSIRRVEAAKEEYAKAPDAAKAAADALDAALQDDDDNNNGDAAGAGAGTGGRSTDGMPPVAAAVGSK